MIHVENLTKIFKTSNQTNPILTNISMQVKKGTWCSVMGPSGTGKSTLLNCLSGLVAPDTGSVHIDETNIYNLNDTQLSDFRRKQIGFVFQDFKLLPHYSVLDNVILPLIYDDDNRKLRKKAKQLLLDIGIREPLFHRLPVGLSGGEKQRVAIARSLIADPDLILCDEPTGNLDIETRNQITELLQQVKERGKTIIVVTHDPEVASFSDMHYTLRNGELTEEVIFT